MRNSRDVVLERREMIIRALTKNPKTTSAQLAKELNVSKITVMRDRIALKRAGLLPEGSYNNTRPAKKLDDVKNKIKALEGFGELDNYPRRELAKRFNCSLYIVTQAIDHLKAEIETPHKIDKEDLDFWNRAKMTALYASYQKDRKNGYLGARLPREEYSRYRAIRKLKDQFYMTDRNEYLRRVDLLLNRARNRKNNS